MPKKIERRQSPIHGSGVFAIAPIARGEKVVRYKGRVRRHDEVDAEYADLNQSGHTFLFSINEEWVIDANHKGNLARWINHSCAPNCEAVHVEDAKGRRHKDKIQLHALRDIALGEELSYNYGIVLGEPHTAARRRLWACHCGSARCTGTLLQPKRKRPPVSGRRAAVAPATTGPD